MTEWIKEESQFGKNAHAEVELTLHSFLHRVTTVAQIFRWITITKNWKWFYQGVFSIPKSFASVFEVLGRQPTFQVSFSISHTTLSNVLKKLWIARGNFKLTENRTDDALPANAPTPKCCGQTARCWQRHLLDFWHFFELLMLFTYIVNLIRVLWRNFTLITCKKVSYQEKGRWKISNSVKISI